MQIVGIFLTIIGMFLTVIILDYIWLGIITKKFLIKQFGSLIKVEKGSIKVNLLAGIITWFIIAIGSFIFVVSNSSNFLNTIFYGAIFGFVVYSIYDLTNLSFLKGYPLRFTFLDILWGTFLCSVISIVGFLIRGLF